MHLDGAQDLIAAGAAVNQMKENGQTALSQAAWGGHAGLVRVLPAANEEIDLGKEDHPRPLFKAAYGGHRPGVRGAGCCWPPAGADKDAKTILGETALGDTAELLR